MKMQVQEMPKPLYSPMLKIDGTNDFLIDSRDDIRILDIQMMDNFKNEDPDNYSRYLDMNG